MRTFATPFLTALLAVCLLPADRAPAQVKPGPAEDGRANRLRAEPNPLLAPLRAQEKPLIADVQRQWFLPAAEQLKLEVELIARVGGLDDEQTKLLLVRGTKAIEQRGGLLGGGRNPGAVQRVVIVDGRRRIEDILAEPPSRAIRRSLMPILKEISPDAAALFRTERDRLDSFRKRASILAQVAIFDECLLLSSEQRARFDEVLTEATSDAWWRPTDPGPMLRTSAHQLFRLLAKGGLGGFIVPEVDLAQLLAPLQFAAFKVLRQPVHDGFALDQNVPRPRAAVALPQPAPAVADVRRAELPVGRDRRPDNQAQRLTRCLEQWVESIDAAGKLSASQREKLLLAGKLDIERLREPEAPRSPSADGEVVQIVQSPEGHLPLAIFGDARSYFQRALRGVLLEEQKQRLVESDRERRDFYRKSLVEAVVIGFESCAALTAEQCERLSLALNGALADADLRETPDWRLDCVRRVIELPEEEVRPILFDFQVNAVRGHKQHLAAAARLDDGTPGKGAQE
jgi:hypothetical protein